jgi:biofilm PGA synthesis lipoprotein PgaB
MRLLPLFVALLLALPAIAAEPEFQVISYHDVRDDVVADYDPDEYAVSTRNLITQFTWLREHGFQPVSVDDILAAYDGGAPLPENAILLTFDDGLESFYTKVYPLLKLFRYPAVVANDNCVRLHGQLIDIPKGPGARSYAAARVEVRQRLDGAYIVFHQARLIATTSPKPIREPIYSRARRKYTTQTQVVETTVYFNSLPN